MTKNTFINKSIALIGYLTTQNKKINLEKSIKFPCNYYKLFNIILCPIKKFNQKKKNISTYYIIKILNEVKICTHSYIFNYNYSTFKLSYIR